MNKLSTVPECEAGFGALETSRGPLPLKALDVKARILGLASRVQVAQTFVNTHREPLEAVYIFPLPPRSAVSGFRMRVGDRVVEGTLFERQQARDQYARALREGRRAALAEEDRPSVFTLSVGNLMPGDVAEVTFELSGLLTLEGDEAEWRFPLVVAQRYIPGAPLGVAPAGLGTTADTDQVPDASRLNPPVLLPGYPSPVRLGIEVDWDPAGLPASGLRANLPTVTEDLGGGRVRFRLAGPERLDCDFILRCALGADRLRATAVRVPGAEGGASTVMVTIVPPRLAPEARPGRDVVFLLDRSGSMGGWKITAARRAVARMVDTLGPRDRFEVATFDSELAFAAGGGLCPATDRNRFRALEFLAGVEARGGTETGPAIRWALDLLKGGGEGREAIVFLVTDGQVGNEDGLLRLVNGACRFQILGIDEAVNDGLLQRLAGAAGGWFLAAESEDRLDAVLAMASRKFGAPLATDLAVPGLDEIVSSGSRDLYPGTPLILLGRCQGAPGTLEVRGAGFEAGLEVRLRDEPAVARTWARWRVRDLEDGLVRGTGDREALVAFSLAHGVLCRFTAFLAVDGAEVVNPEGRVETILQPVEQPRYGAAHAPAPMACESDESPNLACCDMSMSVASPKRSMPPEDPAISARAAAEELVDFLEALGPVPVGTTEDLSLPWAARDLERLLKNRVFKSSEAAQRLRKLLGQRAAPLSELLEAFRAFLKEAAPRAFWA